MHKLDIKRVYPNKQNEEFIGRYSTIDFTNFETKDNNNKRDDTVESGETDSIFVSLSIESDRISNTPNRC